MAEIAKKDSRTKIQSYIAVEGATKALELANDMLDIVLLQIRVSR